MKRALLPLYRATDPGVAPCIGSVVFPFEHKEEIVHFF
jgi:hypothetical protein